MGRMLTKTHSATTLIVESSTLTQAHTADNTWDWMAKDDNRNLAGEGADGKGGSCCYLLSDEPLSAGGVITQHY